MKKVLLIRRTAQPECSDKYAEEILRTPGGNMAKLI